MAEKGTDQEAVPGEQAGDKKIRVAVTISPDDVNAYLTKAILESKLGFKLQEHILKAVEELGKSWHSDAPVRRIVQEEILNMTRNILREEYAETIKQLIIGYLTKEKLDEIAKSAVDSIGIMNATKY